MLLMPLHVHGYWDAPLRTNAPSAMLRAAYAPPAMRPALPAEICSTPSEVGIFEVAHNKSLGPDGKFSWKKVRI